MQSMAGREGCSLKLILRQRPKLLAILLGFYCLAESFISCSHGPCSVANQWVLAPLAALQLTPSSSKEQKVVASLPGHEGSVEAWKRVSECTSRVAPEP